jgi:hypothetical protein
MTAHAIVLRSKPATVSQSIFLVRQRYFLKNLNYDFVGLVFSRPEPHNRLLLVLLNAASLTTLFGRHAISFPFRNIIAL